MFKNSQISISKHFIISLLFIVFIFTSVGVNVNDVCAHDLNQSVDGITSELNIEDKLENSQEDILNTNVEIDEYVSVSQDSEVLGAVVTPKNHTFAGIREAIKSANEGDTIKLSGTYVAQKELDQINLNKKLKITADSTAILDAKGLTRIFIVTDNAKGSSFNNLKFLNAHYDGSGGGMFVHAKDIKVTNCIFENGKSYQGSGIATVYDNYTAVNLLVENCKFINNYAQKTAAAISAYGNNTRLINCTFESNKVYNGSSVCYGGAIQMGLDDYVSQAYIYGCKFYNNYVKPITERAHGGAGCIRDGIIYENCVFVNNSASQGGALTYHGSGMIKNCTFINNTAYFYGGALSNGFNYISGDLKVDNCNFQGNDAPLGGAVQLLSQNISITKCNFNSNNASKNGGAININAETVNIVDSTFNQNIASIDGGAVFINGKYTSIKNSLFKNNGAIPDFDKLDDGLGGAVYINSTRAFIENNEFYFNTARNGSAIYYDKYGDQLKLSNNTLYQNQAWVYALPIYVNDIYYGETEDIGSIIHGGNNIAKYGNLAVSNAIYNAASNDLIEIDGETPVLGATTSGQLYQDDREYNMNILLTVVHEDGTVVYNHTLNSDNFGEVKIKLNNLKVGKYFVTAKHYEDTYYKAITNTTSFIVSAHIDVEVKKSVSPKQINYNDLVIWALNITNNGPNNATGVIVKDMLPEGLEWIEDNTNGKYNPQTGILRLDSLKVGEIYIVKIITKVKKTGTIVNKVDITANEKDNNLTNNHDQSIVTVNPSSDLAVIKSVNVSNVNLHDSVKWTIIVSNNGPDTATGVIVNDLLPKSLIWVNDDSSGKYDYNTGKWNVGTLNNGNSVRLNIVCKVNATGSIKNIVSVTGNEFDWNKSNNNATKTVNVYRVSDLSIVKSVSPSIVNYADVVCWTLTVTNYGPDAATGVKVYDNLPSGFVYLNSSKPYSNGVIDIGNLAVGDTVSVKIYSKADITGSFVNVASVKGNEFDQNPSNNKANVSVLVKPATDLKVTKTSNASVINLNDLVKWTITVKNNGPDTATGVIVNDLLPKSLIWVNDDSSGKYDPNAGKWNVGTLNNGSSVRLNIVCKVNATGSIKNIVSVTGNEFDWNKSNNNATKTVNVNAASDLGIVKSVSPGVVNYADVVCWTLTVTNYGPDAATGVKINETLPDGFIYLNSTKPYSNGIINVGNLAVGDSVSVKIYSKANITGSFVNVASVKGNEFDQNPSNNKANVSVLVKPASDLQITKSVNNSNPNFADKIKWTITVRNNGPDTATGVIVKDLLSESLIWINDDSSGKYNHNSGIWNIGNINKGETKTLTIVSEVNGTGLIVNNVSVSGNEFDWNHYNNRDNESINVSNASDLSVIKFANQSEVNYHQLVKWTLIAKNNGPDKATGVLVEDVLPAGLQLINYTASKGFYDNGLWSLCCLEKGENQTLELVCYVNKTGKLTNIAKINGNEFDPILSNNENKSSAVVPKSSDLSVVKNVNDTNPYFGDMIEWSITVANNGPDDCDDVSVIDELPEGLEFVEYTCSSGSYGKGMWYVGHLNNGDSASLVIRCIVRTLHDCENIAKVVSSQYDWNESNNKDNVSITVNPLADLAIVKLVNVSTANYLDLVKWTLIVTNYGPNEATEVVVRDVIPEGLTVVDVYGEGIYEDSIWDIGYLDCDETKQLDIVCEIQKTGDFTNIASVWAFETDSNLENNEDENYLFVYPASDISITKTVSKYKYAVGDVVRFSIKLTNNGPNEAKNVRVREIMDDSLELLSFQVSAGDFDKVNDVWSLDLLDVGRSAVLEIKAIATKAGIAENKVVATNDNYDPDLSNNNDTVSVDIVEKQKHENIPKNSKQKQSISEIKSYTQSILEKYKSGNPIMTIILLFVFSMGVFYGNNILKKR